MNNAASKGELVTAMNVLVRRRSNTTDPAEKTVINQTLEQLSDQIEALDQADLLTAARIVAEAGDALERVVAAARVGPFDNFLSDIQGVMQRLQGDLRQMHAAEGLPPAVEAAPAPAPAPVAAAPAPRAPATASASAPAPAVAASTKPINSKVFSELEKEYESFFARCELRPEFASNLEFYLSRLAKFKPVYQDVGDPLGVPWAFIGIAHGMEGGFDFSTHLHNGDPLTARTVQVPKGRPTAGSPPFTWRESARDAMVFKGFDRVTDWSVPRMLFLWETNNGFGYRPLGLPSPYLWSFSNLYSKGKFVADHVFDPNAVSRQCGTALMLKGLQQRGLF